MTAQACREACISASQDTLYTEWKLTLPYRAVPYRPDVGKPTMNEVGRLGGVGMTNLLDNARSLFNGLTRTAAKPPLFTAIPDDRVDVPLGNGTLVPGRDYFEVRVVRVHLAYEREWFSRYAPVVLAATEFSYDGDTTVAPVVVGPG